MSTESRYELWLANNFFYSANECPDPKKAWGEASFSVRSTVHEFLQEEAAKFGLESIYH